MHYFTKDDLNLYNLIIKLKSNGIPFLVFTFWITQMTCLFQSVVHVEKLECANSQYICDWSLYCLYNVVA